MKIEPVQFSEGVQFNITAENATERVLLLACVNVDAVLEATETDDVFILTLPVANE
jgi:hypothetical protein